MPPAEAFHALRDPDVRSVLLVRLRVGLGDLLCTVPALRALRALRPDLHVAVATWPETAGVVGRYPQLVDELVPFPGVEGIPERPPDGTFTTWAAGQRERGWDLALQLYGDNPAAGRVVDAVRARRSGGFAASTDSRDAAGWLRYPHALHEVDRHLRALELLGLPPDASRELSWPVLPGDEPPPVPGPYVVLHPGATSPSRLWPAERFAAVGDALAAQGLVVVVGGVPSERSLTSAVVTAMRAPALDLTGATTLGQYAVLLRDAAVVVANDTGTAHLTAAVGGHCVTVFLSGDPRRWRHAPHLQTVVQERVGCDPCPHLVCPIDHRCATRTTADRVTAAALARLTRAGRLPRPAGPSAAP